MMRPLDLSPAALGFISGTGPALPAAVLGALALPGEGELYGAGRSPGRGAGGGEGASLSPSTSRDPEVHELVVREFAERAARSLDEVLRAPEGGRELAFQLLVADALLTWACEAAAAVPEPDRMLRGVVSALTVTTP